MGTFFLIFGLRIRFLNKLHLRIFHVSAFLQIPILEFNTSFNIAIEHQIPVKNSNSVVFSEQHYIYKCKLLSLAVSMR